MLTFNIIYTKDSVSVLSNFVLSLLDHTNYNFRLVANGCSLIEKGALIKMCESNSRLSYWSYPSSTIAAHGSVLNMLQGMNKDEYFCFMDSDIFATGQIENHENYLKEQRLSALFSALPIWVKENETTFKKGFKNLVGTFNKLNYGDCIGGTYFAIYDNKALGEIMQYYSVGFDEMYFKDLEPIIQKSFLDLGYKPHALDTGKVINFLLLSQNKKMANILVDELCHIGGTSFEVERNNEIKKWYKNDKGSLHFFKKIYFRFKNRILPKEELRINYNQRLLHRNMTRAHFINLMHSLVQGSNIPLPLKMEDREINNNLNRAHFAVVDLFNKYIKSKELE